MKITLRRKHKFEVSFQLKRVRKQICFTLMMNEFFDEIASQGMFAMGRLVSVMLSTRLSPAFMLLCNIVRSSHVFTCFVS